MRSEGNSDHVSATAATRELAPAVRHSPARDVDHDMATCGSVLISPQNLLLCVASFVKVSFSRNSCVLKSCLCAVRNGYQITLEDWRGAPAGSAVISSFVLWTQPRPRHSHLRTTGAEC